MVYNPLGGAGELYSWVYIFSHRVAMSVCVSVILSVCMSVCDSSKHPLLEILENGDLWLKGKSLILALSVSMIFHVFGDSLLLASPL